jgi:hypothetical protein
MTEILGILQADAERGIGKIIAIIVVIFIGSLAYGLLTILGLRTAKEKIFATIVKLGLISLVIIFAVLFIINNHFL